VSPCSRSSTFSYCESQAVYSAVCTVGETSARDARDGRRIILGSKCLRRDHEQGLRCCGLLPWYGIAPHRRFAREHAGAPAAERGPGARITRRRRWESARRRRQSRPTAGAATLTPSPKMSSPSMMISPMLIRPGRREDLGTDLLSQRGVRHLLRLRGRSTANWAIVSASHLAWHHADFASEHLAQVRPIRDETAGFWKFPEQANEGEPFAIEARVSPAARRVMFLRSAGVALRAISRAAETCLCG